MAKCLPRTAGRAIVLGAWLIAFVAHGNAEPARRAAEKAALPDVKPAAAKTSTGGDAAPATSSTTAKPATPKAKAKAASGYQTVPNEQLGLGCSSAE